MIGSGSVNYHKSVVKRCCMLYCQIRILCIKICNILCRQSGTWKCVKYHIHAFLFLCQDIQCHNIHISVNQHNSFAGLPDQVCNKCKSIKNLTVKENLLIIVCIMGLKPSP